MNGEKNNKTSPFAAAVFLMATSAIGPGFLTQTALFTSQLKASFGFVILISILLDIGAQLNIWRIITVSKMRAQDIANKVLAGSGHALTIAVVLGGLAFNTGNLAGAGLGIQVLTGLGVKEGAFISALIVLVTLTSKNALKWLDLMIRVLGISMILLTLYVVIVAKPPLLEALNKTFLPDQTDLRSIVTLVGGTVGGYITFAGGHRLIDAGIYGKAAMPQVTRSAISAVLLASVMRVMLFLSALGVLHAGSSLDASNPAASVFQLAAGQTGYKIFGMVMWCAALTSVTGSAYTSVSFLKTLHPELFNREKYLVTAFVVISIVLFLVIGQPVQVLVTAGLINGFILPFALVLMLLAVYNKKIMADYRHPPWLTAFGITVVGLTLWMSVSSILNNT